MPQKAKMFRAWLYRVHGSSRCLPVICLHTPPWVTSEVWTRHDGKWIRSRQTHSWFCLKTKNCIYNTFYLLMSKEALPSQHHIYLLIPHDMLYYATETPCVALNTAWLRRQTCWGLSSPGCLLSLFHLLSLTGGNPHCWRRTLLRVCTTGLLEGCWLIRSTTI